MRYLLKLGTNYLKYEAIRIKRKRLDLAEYGRSIKAYAGHTVRTSEQINRIIYDEIKSGKPMCVARFGSTELFCASMFEFDIKSKQGKAMNQICTTAGFFPENISYGDDFNKSLKDACLEVDVLGEWRLRFEEYYIKKYMNQDIEIAYLYDIEPWTCPEHPWSEALKGKKVLIIHPFEETIRSQYSQREKIFPGTNILPEFELLTMKAVQTIAGTKDERFLNWFDALNYMYQEAMKIDFDIAILGCGAYGMPLAAKLKKAGKQAIHLGGATQILFGIRGKRWDEQPDKEYIRKFYNDYWVHPSEQDKPLNANVVEGGCYW